MGRSAGCHAPSLIIRTKASGLTPIEPLGRDGLRELIRRRLREGSVTERWLDEAQQPGMTLYQGDGPNSYRVRIFMADKGVDVPSVAISFAKMEHRTPE